tara:strand:- start:536 stop:766 length:231 start_codon:yes stop_codon:yes gene_type:complete
MSTDKKQNNFSLFDSWAFGKLNYILFSIGLALVIFGYIFMASGDVNSFQSLTLAPIMLFLGYIVVIPISLVYRDKQ